MVFRMELYLKSGNSNLGILFVPYYSVTNQYKKIMKAKILFLYLLIFASYTSVLAQPDTDDTYFPNWRFQNTRHTNEATEDISSRAKGAYLGITLNYTEIDRNNALLLGSKGGWILRSNTSLGLGGYVFINQYSPNPQLGRVNEYGYSIGGAYAGIFAEQALWANKPLHLSIPVFAGYGGVIYNSEYYSMGQWYSDIEDTDDYFLVDTGIELEINVNRNIRLLLGTYYRRTTAISLQTLNDQNELLTITDRNALNGFSVGATIKIGKF